MEERISPSLISFVHNLIPNIWKTISVSLLVFRTGFRPLFDTSGLEIALKQIS